MGGGEARIPVFFLAARRQGRAVGFLGEGVAGAQPLYRYGLRAAIGFTSHSFTQNRRIYCQK